MKLRDTGIVLLILGAGVGTMAGGVPGLLAVATVAGACILIGRNP